MGDNVGGPVPGARRGTAVGAPPRLPRQIRARFPILPRNFVRRERLWQRLDAAAQGPVTLVVAPVGAGKTLGAAGWVKTRDLADSTLWVTVTPELDVDGLVSLLSQGAARPDWLLVLDDAHRLTPGAMSELDRRLTEDPESLHVLLLSRWDLPLTRLVPELLGHLTVLRGGVLRLDAVETEALVREHARTGAEAVVEAIGQLAQGWCAIAVLAAKAVGADRDPVRAAARLLQGPSPVGDRVLSEVFASLSSRQRHLLLCVVGENRVSARVARHLSQDPGAQQTLDELESTGLLVTRHEDIGEFRTRSPGQESTYEIHPLLREVIQRRVRVGGVDVVRARASVRQAVDSDVAQGDVADAFRRLHAMNASTEVVDLLASHGVDLAISGGLSGMRDFLRRHAAAVERNPLCSFPIALERWQAGDIKAAKPWLHRFLGWAAGSTSGRRPAGATDDRTSLAVACARLMLARVGDGNLAEAVLSAEAELLTPREYDVGAETLSQLVKFLAGTAQMRLGHVGGAERHLASVAAQSRETGSSGLALAASAQLAVTQFLLGREHACLDLAESVSRALRVSRSRVGPNEVRLTADVARGLAVVQRVLLPERAVAGDEDLEERATVHGDPVVAGLSRLLRARSLLLRGAVAQAEQALMGGTTLEDLPRPLVRLVAFEQALQSVLASDWRRLADLEVLLTGTGALAEATLVAGLRADGLDDTRAAAEMYAAAAAQAKTAQPPTGAIALVCRAQVVDVLGHTEDALEHLGAAVTATQARRNALPFLGWSRHGTPIATLLQRLSGRVGTDWSRHLAAETISSPGGIASAAEPLTATPRERAQVPDGVLRPSLSPRERDVLHQLARGATYADVAANLYVSENTVKTHVSSLYAKLAVSRRSDALAVARTLRLL